MNYVKRPLNSPSTEQLEKKLNLNVSSDLEVSFSTQSFKSAVSFDSNSTITESMTSVDLAIASSPEIIDVICTQVYEINGQPYLTPSLTDDDALEMLRQVWVFNPHFFCHYLTSFFQNLAKYSKSTRARSLDWLNLSPKIEASDLILSSTILWVLTWKNLKSSRSKLKTTSTLGKYLFH